MPWRCTAGRHDQVRVEDAGQRHPHPGEGSTLWHRWRPGGRGRRIGGDRGAEQASRACARRFLPGMSSFPARAHTAPRRARGSARSCRGQGGLRRFRRMSSSAFVSGATLCDPPAAAKLCTERARSRRGRMPKSHRATTGHGLAGRHTLRAGAARTGGYDARPRRPTSCRYSRRLTGSRAPRSATARRSGRRRHTGRCQPGPAQQRVGEGDRQRRDSPWLSLARHAGEVFDLAERRQAALLALSSDRAQRSPLGPGHRIHHADPSLPASSTRARGAGSGRADAAKEAAAPGPDRLPWPRTTGSSIVTLPREVTPGRFRASAGPYSRISRSATPTSVVRAARSARPTTPGSPS